MVHIISEDAMGVWKKNKGEDNLMKDTPTTPQ